MVPQKTFKLLGRGGQLVIPPFSVPAAIAGLSTAGSKALVIFRQVPRLYTNG
jgi:hypothetical protein